MHLRVIVFLVLIAIPLVESASAESVSQRCENGSGQSRIAACTEAIKNNPKKWLYYKNRGYEYYAAGDYESAIADFNTAIKLNPRDSYSYGARGLIWGIKEEYERSIADLTQSLKLDRSDPSTWLDRGTTYLRLKQYDAAIDDFTKSIRLHPTFSGGLALIYRGDAFRYKNNFDKAISDYDRVLKEFPDSADAYRGRGAVFEHQVDYDRALNDFSRALAIRETVRGPDHADTASSLGDLAALLVKKGDYDGAETLVRRALAIREKALGPNHPHTAYSLNYLARLLLNKDDYRGAEPLIRRALAIREKALGPDHADTAYSLDSLGQLLSMKGDYDGAEPLYRRAWAIREKALGPDHPDTASSINKIAGLLVEKDDYDGAEPLIRRALAIREKALGPDHADTAYSLDSLGQLLSMKGDYDGAEPLYRRAWAIREKALGPDHPDTASSMNNLAVLLFDKGDYDGAEPLYRRALANVEKALGPNHSITALSLNNLAALLEATGDYEGAEPLYRRALAIYQKALGPDHPEMARSLNNLAQLLLETGVPLEALDLSRRAAVSGNPQRDAYLRALHVAESPSKPLISESFSVVQSTSSSEAGSALVSLSARFSAGNSALAQLVRQEQDESSRESVLDKAFFAEAGKPSKERNPKREEALEGQIADVKKRLAAIRARLASDFPDYAELQKPRPLELAEAQLLLKEDEALVIVDTVKDGEGDYIWAVTTTDAAWQKLETAKGEIDDLVAALLQALNPDNQSEVDLAKAHRLYQVTLGAVVKQISGKKHLIFVLDGAMTSLPPHVLVTQDPAGKTLKDAGWLIEDYAVTVLPTVSSLKLLRSGKTVAAAPKPMRGYADIAYAPGGVAGNLEVASRSISDAFTGGVANTRALQDASPLPATGPEARAVMQVLGGDQGDILTGRAATEAEVKAAKLSDYRVLYFATHGLLAGEVEDLAKVRSEPALLFAVPEKPTPEDDGLLTASELAQLKLNADWAVLSACNTAAGGKPGAAALSGLARAFFYAGARSLLVSHWPVDDEATQALMVRLFENVKANPGKRAAEAQQEAMLSVMNDQGNPQWANPAYWAPFILVGEPRI